jgi:hypothetical protein
MRYNHFDMLPERAFLKVGGQIKPQGGGGGGNPGPTQTNVTQTNIPQYAQPYVESMLGSTQQQLFNTAQRQTGTDDAGNPTYTTDITGIKPYQPYSANPADYVAGFSPLQNQGFTDIANMQVAPQIAMGTNLANRSSEGALSTAAPAMGYGARGVGIGQQGIGIGQIGLGQGLSYGQNAVNPSAVQAYMNPYLEASLAPQLQLSNQQFGIQNAANQAQATQQGAFGGGRQAIMQGLNQQNRALATNQLVSQGYNNAYNIANQNMQAAAQLGMQGAGVGLQGINAGLQGVNTGLQGVQGAQNAYGLGLQGANTLNALGNSLYNQQMGIAQARLGAGGQQQQQQQNITNQAIQNYATAQQYPQQQLAFMNSMLRGLPLQTSTVQQYQAAPSMGSQAAGLGVAGLGAYQLLKAEGGQIKEKHFAAGGIASGVPKDKLDGMLDRLSDQQLMQKADVKQNDPDTAIAAAGQQAFRARMRNPGIGAAPAPSMNRFAGGGIVAFAGPDGSLVEEPKTAPRSFAGQSRISYDQIFGQPSAEAMESNVARIKSLTGENTAGKGLLEFLEQRQTEGAGDKEKQGAMRFLQAGLGILGGASPYAGVNIGKGAEPAVVGAMADVKEQRAEDMAMAKARYDVENMSYQDRMNIVKMANEDEQKTRQMLAQVYGSDRQADATIGAARISADRALDVERERGKNQLALETEKNRTNVDTNFIAGRTEQYIAAGAKPDVAADRARQDLFVLKHPGQNDLANIGSILGTEANYTKAHPEVVAKQEALRIAQLEPKKKDALKAAQDAAAKALETARAEYKNLFKYVQNQAQGQTTRPGTLPTPTGGNAPPAAGGNIPPLPPGFTPLNP